MNPSAQPNESAPDSPEIKQAYDAYTAEVRVRNSKVACMLVIALMPAGFVLDSFVYSPQVGHFFVLRCIASALAFLVFLGSAAARPDGVAVPAAVHGLVPCCRLFHLRG